MGIYFQSSKWGAPGGHRPQLGGGGGARDPHAPPHSYATGIWTTNVKLTRAKWSGLTEHSSLCSAHLTSTCFERGLHSQFGVAYKAMLLPDAIPTIFPLSKKAVKAPTRREVFFKARIDSR